MARHKGDAARLARWERKQAGELKRGPKYKKREVQAPPVESNTVITYAEYSSFVTLSDVVYKVSWDFGDPIYALKRLEDPNEESYSQDTLNFGADKIHELDWIH